MSEGSHLGDQHPTVADGAVRPSLQPGTWGAQPVDDQSFAPRQRRRFPGWAVLAICLPLAFTVLAGAVVLGTPSAKHARRVPVDYRVAVPLTIDGLTKARDSAEFERETSNATSSSPASLWSQTVAAIFTDGTHDRRLRVIARHTRVPWSHHSQHLFVTTFWAHYKPDEDMIMASVSRRSSGHLGGMVSCRTMNGAIGIAEICLEFNQQTLVTMTDFSSGHRRKLDPAFVTTVREAFVHRL